jgi:hypothetical protein
MINDLVMWGYGIYIYGIISSTEIRAAAQISELANSWNEEKILSSIIF